MLQVAGQQRRQALGLELPRHGGRGATPASGLAAVEVASVGAVAAIPARTSAPRSVPTRTTNRCPSASSELGQGQVEPVIGPGPGAHRGAEAGGGGRAALGDDDEGPAAAIRVTRVRGRAVPQHPVEDVEGGQLARSGPDDGHGRPSGLRVR